MRRECREDGCGTVLSAYNGSDHCFLHQPPQAPRNYAQRRYNGFLEQREAEPPPKGFDSWHHYDLWDATMRANAPESPSHRPSRRRSATPQDLRDYQPQENPVKVRYEP